MPVRIQINGVTQASATAGNTTGSASFSQGDNVVIQADARDLGDAVGQDVHGDVTLEP